MIRLTQQSRIHLAVQAVDFRKQLDSLIALCENEWRQTTRTGDWFVFMNRARTMVRGLVYEGSGYWLVTKRLSRGRYRYWPKSAAALTPCAATELMRLLRNEED